MYEIYKKLCAEKGVTSYRVAKDTGISQSSLSEWKEAYESGGSYTPKLDKLKKLADYFGVSVTVFIE